MKTPKPYDPGTFINDSKAALVLLQLVMLEYLQFDMDTDEVRFNGLRYSFKPDNPQWDKIVKLLGGYEYLEDMIENESGRKL
jgi:hypothetical protein